MPSVVGLLEQREVVARRRVDGLREEADRVQAELAVAEREWREWAIACSRVGEVLAPVDKPAQSHARTEETSSAPTAARSRSQVPAWCEGLAWSVLSVDYQRTRRLARDFERRTTSAEAMVYWSMTLLMTRRLARPHPGRG